MKDQQHQDAVEANPFSARNVIVGVGASLFVLLFSALCAMAWSSISDGQAKMGLWLKEISESSKQTHDILMQHGYMLTNLHDQFIELKANSMDKDQVDDRIRALMPHSGASMFPHDIVSPLSTLTNAWYGPYSPPINGGNQPTSIDGGVEFLPYVPYSFPSNAFIVLPTNFPIVDTRNTNGFMALTNIWNDHVSPLASTNEATTLGDD